MKLYIWRDLVSGYGVGCAFAIAESVEQAREIIKASKNGWRVDRDETDSEAAINFEADPTEVVELDRPYGNVTIYQE